MLVWIVLLLGMSQVRPDLRFTLAGDGNGPSSAASVTCCREPFSRRLRRFDMMMRSLNYLMSFKCI